MKVRRAAVAGTFYPAAAEELHSLLRACFGDARGGVSGSEAPKALIAPHAGYVYSGPIAASAWSRLANARGIERVVLMGPAHRVPLRGFAVPECEAFATPLGEVRLDREAIARLLTLPTVRAFDPPHELEHSLEVQLPFLQTVLGDPAVVPLVAGDATPEEAAEVFEMLWGGPETLLVVSSDLSHYYDSDTARRMDAATSAAIEAMRPDDLRYEDACGRLPIQGLLLAARRHGLHVETLDLRNSGDTAGSRDAVVGYGAWALA